ncbi:DUF4442 domain-containing protein [bacterium]|nr:DUF4442 domain-containing protein [bacterium]
MNWKQTLAIRAFSLKNLPLLFLIRPQIIEMNEKRCEAVIPLNYLTRNHVKSMYFGVLAMGADLAGGLSMVDAIEKTGNKVGFIFKDFTANFIKRAMSDVHFICEEGEIATKAVKETLKTKKRVNATVNMYATTPKVSGDEHVAEFTLTLSVKAK